MTCRSKELYKTDGIHEAHCSRCKKLFVVQPFLVYKRGNKRFCSYHCYNDYLNEVESKRGRGRKR